MGRSMKSLTRHSPSEEETRSSEVTCVGCDELKKMERLMCDDCVAEYESVLNQKKEKSIC